MIKFKNIFYIKHSCNHTIINILGIKIKIKNKSLLQDVNNKLDLLLQNQYLTKAKGYSRIVQTIDFDILQEVNRICEKYNISYWLEGGTLLGAIRHKGFIPWDDDLDISMMYGDYLRFQEIINEELKHTNYIFKKVPSHIGKILCKDFSPNSDEKLLNFINWSEEERLYMALDIFPYHFIKNEFKDTARKNLELARLEKIKLYKKYKNINDFDKIQTFIDEINAKYTTLERQEKVFLGLETVDQKVMIFNYDDIFPLIKVEFEGKYFYAPRKYKVLLQEQYDDFMKPVIFRNHLNFSNICKEDKLKLLEYETIEEREGK